MLLLWAALFILLLGKRVKGEQLLSSAQVDVYTTSSSEDAITCLGSVPTNFNEDFYYEDTFNFDTFQGERRHHDLAAFCVKAVRARCHTSGSEQYIAFDTLLSYEAEHIARWRKWPIETTASRPDGPHVGLLEDPTYRQIQLISEICQIKCRCSHPLPGLDLTFYQKPQAPGGEQRGFYNWDDRFFEWNFDSHISRWRDSHDIEDGEEEHNLRQAWWKGGFVDPNYRGGRFSDGNWETGSLTAGRQTYQYC
ncbi:MAG: hypothetical protein M1814_006097 [Vezdaea aestivalis]|nr:MAG: hypothetical protein M1814_006097 [Vezdaea aestivalis]